MGLIPGFDATVTRNGVSVRAKQVRVRREVGKATPQWSLTLNEPISDLSFTDTWTITRSIAGYPQTLIESVEPTNISATDAGGYANRNISGGAGTAASDDLLTYGVPKTLVFYNETWAASLSPPATLVDGILKTAPLILPGYGTTLPSRRVYDDRLPGQDIKDTDFLCIPALTHHGIARYLSALVGYELVVNTPDLQLTDTFTVPSGTTWMSAIQANFSIWSPNIQIIGKKIYILDTLTDSANIEPLQILSIDNPAIVSTNSSVSKIDGQTVDHLIVIGRKTKNVTLNQDEKPDFTPITIPEGPELSVDLIVEPEIDFSDLQNILQMDSPYTGSFGDPAYTPNAMGAAGNIQKYHVERHPTRGDKWILVEETAIITDSQGNEIGKTVTQYKHSKDFKPVRTIEKEYNTTTMPGVSTPTSTLTKVKTTMQDKFVKPLNVTLTREVEEQVVIYDESTNSSGETYKDSPITFRAGTANDTTRDFIDTDSGTSQKYVTMPVRYKQSFISRAHDDVLIKKDLTYDALTGKVSMNSQILENPKKEPKAQSSDAVFRREYFNGSGKMFGSYGPCYHAAKTINHQDITSDAIAEQIKTRVFAKYDSDNSFELTIQTPVPIPIETTHIKVRLPAFSQEVNGTLVTVAGGDYVLKAVEDVISWDGNENDVEIKSEQTLTVRIKP